mgnify:FL=1
MAIFVNDGGTIKPYTMKEAGGFLDQLYNSKKTWDAIRTGSMELPDQFKEIIEY